MYVINARNVHDALPEALRKLKLVGVYRDSRNGPVTMFPMPVTTAYGAPNERVLFHPVRDANPFFHLFESLWMLAGRNDVGYVARYVPAMANYSDNGVTFHGAYGHRWRNHFLIDQISMVIQQLTINPDDRRCVIQMWDATTDLGRQGKDFPCNTSIMFSVNWLGKVDMLVTNRSNDMVMGCYGANAVHMSFLQEYVAASLGREVGSYYQVSNNLHMYEDTRQKVEGLIREVAQDNPYALKQVHAMPLMPEGRAAFDLDLMVYIEKGPTVGFSTRFFRQVVTPMHFAWEAYKKKSNPDRFRHAHENILQCQASDWQRACTEWLYRREDNVNAN